MDFSEQLDETLSIIEDREFKSPEETSEPKWTPEQIAASEWRGLPPEIMDAVFQLDVDTDQRIDLLRIIRKFVPRPEDKDISSLER